MNKLAYFSLIFFSLNLFSQDINYLERYKLTHFWAQEYIGADLAKEATNQNFEFNFKTIKLGILDGGFYFDSSDKETAIISKEFHERYDNYKHRHHGTAVSNIILDKTDQGYGVTKNAELKVMQTLVKTDDHQSLIDDILSLDKKDRPEIFNFSMHTSPKGYTFLEKLPENNILFIASAGNDFPLEMDPDLTRIKSFIKVGSLSPWGLPSFFSNEGDVKVISPSNREIQSLVGSKAVYFGGTSGAAPMVTGAFSHIKSIQPEISKKQLLYLTKKTQTQVLKSISSQYKQAPLLNVYKMTMVALKIRSICKEDKHCVDKTLKLSSIYNFKPLKEIRTSSECMDRDLDDFFNLNLKNESFEQDNDLKTLRKEFLLSHSKRSSKLLACHYRSKGYIPQSLFYINALMTKEGQTSKLRKLFTQFFKEQLLNNLPIKSKEFTYVSSHISYDFFDVYKKLIESKEFDLMNQALPMMARMRDKKSEAYMWEAYNHPKNWPAFKITILDAAYINHPNKFKKYYEYALLHGNKPMKERAAQLYKRLSQND